MERIKQMSAGKFAVFGAIVIANAILLFVCVAVIIYYYTGYSDTETWVNPLNTSDPLKKTTTPSWSCTGGSTRVLFKNAVFTVTDAAGVVHSADVTAVLNTMRPANGTISLNGPLSAYSFQFPDGFKPTPAAVLNASKDFGSTTPTYDAVEAAVSAAGAGGAPVWSDSAVTSRAANNAGWTTYGSPYSPGTTNGNILQYGAEDATATLTLKYKCI